MCRVVEVEELGPAFAEVGRGGLEEVHYDDVVELEPIGLADPQHVHRRRRTAPLGRRARPGRRGVGVSACAVRGYVR